MSIKTLLIELTKASQELTESEKQEILQEIERRFTFA